MACKLDKKGSEEPDGFHSSGLTSLSRHILSKLLNNLLITLLAAKLVPAIMEDIVNGGSIALNNRN